MTYAELKKLGKGKAEGLPCFRLAVMGDASTQHLCVAIKGCARQAGVNIEVLDADYNQIRAQLTDAGSETYAFKPDAVLMYMSSETLLKAFYDTPAADRARFAERKIAEIRALWDAFRARSNALLLQFNFTLLDDGCFGSFAYKTEASFPYQLQKLNFLLSEVCQTGSGADIVDLNGVQCAMGRAAFFDDTLYAVSRLALSMDALPEVAKRVTDAVLAHMGRVKKCVVTDLDGTLWGGVIGDDGLNGIQIGELGEGRAYTQLQWYLLELKRRGILLAVCSKNELAAAREPFEKHPDMVLRLDDFVVFIADWNDKAANIREIQKRLNIGMESMVFLDDNPFERNAVRGQIPEIAVPDLPEDPARVVACLRALNLFETASFSAEDEGRTQKYIQEAARTARMNAVSSYDDYLKGLHMRAVCAPFDAFHAPRVAQLTQRSNQFNLRTVRYNEEAIASLIGNPEYITRYYTLNDDVGDYGLIAVVILKKQTENDALFVDTWLMSCRVLKRGVEEFIVNDMMALARENHVRRVVGEYIQTPKNAMVADIYSRMGFTLGGGRFVADAEAFSPLPTHILKEVNKNDATGNI